MTEAEATYMAHIKDNAHAWRWTRSEVLASAEQYAQLDPYQLSRLPELLRAEMNNAKEKKACP